MQLLVHCLAISPVLQDFSAASPILADLSFIYAKYYSYVAHPGQIGRRTPVFWFLS